MSQIHDDYAEYSINGLVSGTKNPTSPSGNGILYTAEKLLILQDNQALVLDDLNNFETALRTQCQVEPGLLQRNLTDKDQEGPDDYVGVASAGTKYAQEILAYGRSHYFKWGPFSVPYYYENETLGSSIDSRAELGRQTQLIAHFQYAAGEVPALWRRLYWFFVVATTGLFNDDQDSYRLSYILTRTAPKRLSTRLGTWFFNRRLKKSMYGSMAVLYAAYFGDANHPHAKWSKH